MRDLKEPKIHLQRLLMLQILYLFYNNFFNLSQVAVYFSHSQLLPFWNIDIYID